uniref:Lysosomal Pro-X carboxypeptidase n=1 Tax=Spongospora subterranea TaxID=70186 RepID=A0A0H5R2S4_9EUKA|eukprot:CRZ02199.1 hypothetical protein [Spongospora subterranea]
MTVMMSIFLLFCAHCVLASRPPRFPVQSQTVQLRDNHGTSLFCNLPFDTKWIKMPVDHFNFQNQQTFMLRTLVNADFFNVTNPVILFYSGNEGSIEVFANNTGFMCELAGEFGAMLVFAEHRYFGESIPSGPRSSLGYLSVDLALTDFANVIVEIKQQYGVPDATVITFGGSYGGMLSAWLRMKYPHVVAGAIAASAPIFQFAGLTPTDTFNDIVFRTFDSALEGCASKFRSMFDVVAESSLQHLSKVFSLCEPLESRDDLVQWITDALTYLAMVDYPFAANFIKPLPSWPVNQTCSILLDDSHPASPLEKFAASLSVFFNSTGEAGTCYNIADGTITSVDEQGWDYLSCSSMVIPMSSGRNSMFPPSEWDEDAYDLQCRKKYGVCPRPKFAEIQFGAKKISAFSNIVFSNGNLDPWSGGGVLESVSSSLVAVVIEGAAHHLDLRASAEGDSASLIAARNVHRANIKKWITEDQGGKKAVILMQEPHFAVE